MIIVPTPVHTTRERTQTPAEKADTEAKNRYDDEPRREAFRVGARWERGEDDERWPFGFFGTVAGILLTINILFFLATIP